MSDSDDEERCTVSDEVDLRLLNVAIETLTPERRSVRPARRVDATSRRPAAVPLWTVELCAVATATAILAFAGGPALVVGALDRGQIVDSRLPWDSPVASGIALMAVVAAPMTRAAVALYFVAPGCGRLTATAGGLLLVWLAVETAILRAPDGLQLMAVAAGLVLAIGGVRHWVVAVPTLSSHG